VEMSAAEVTRFLSSLAVEGKVAASTQLLPVVRTFAVALTIPRSQRLQALILRRGRHVARSYPFSGCLLSSPGKSGCFSSSSAY